MPDKLTMKLSLAGLATILIGGCVIIMATILKPQEKQATLQMSQPVFNISKHLKYSFTLRNNSDKNLTQSTFWVYAPVKETASQQVQSIKASHEYELITDKFNNQILAFQLKQFAPYASKLLSLKISLKMSETPNRQTLSAADHYLKSTHFLNLSDPKIKQLSSQLHHKNLAQSAINAYQWSVDNIRYSGYRARQLTASETLNTREGDCTEYMHVLTAINRSNRIPTREVGGYIVAQSRILKASEYHNWAESYLDGRWQLSDPQNKKHQHSHHHYIAFQYYGDDPLNPLNDVHRYKVSDPLISVTMN